MKKISFWVLGALAFLLSFGGIAFAADAVDPSQSASVDIAKSIFNAFSGGHYAYAAAMGLILGVALVKRYLGPKVPWLHSDIGGTALTLSGAFGTALAAGLAAPTASVTWSLVKTSLLVGVGAAGGYSVIKKLIIEPLIKPLQAKLPAWAQPMFSVVLWIFDKPEAAAVAEQDASKAGDAAVAANPGQGASAVLGKPTEIK